ncbi:MULTISPECIES: DUF1491 family protein [Stappiaceae]|uniref:DUF1491 family protein n=1 Tax=Stappiaceae TaxID=2821832 RepID=UPI00129B2C39|nr:DUF1491 family protein [Labrenzia sp. CE80]
MRVTSDFFVTALVRRIFAENGFAAIQKKGAPEAGAIFVAVDRLDGTYDFYGPAPQAMFMDQPQGRLFEQILEKVPRSDITARLEREARMDPDYWMVEVDSEAGKIDLPLAEEEAEKAPDPFFKF